MFKSSYQTPHGCHKRVRCMAQCLASLKSWTQGQRWSKDSHRSPSWCPPLPPSLPPMWGSSRWASHPCMVSAAWEVQVVNLNTQLSMTSLTHHWHLPMAETSQCPFYIQATQCIFWFHWMWHLLLDPPYILTLTKFYCCTNHLVLQLKSIETSMQSYFERILFLVHMVLLLLIHTGHTLILLGKNSAAATVFISI